jgi:hypothetical protein
MWIATDLNDIVHEIFPGLMVSLLVYVIVSWKMPANNDERVQRYFV